MKWIERIPTGILAVAAIAMALAPFAPEPHLVEKFRMLTAGTLTRPIDIFDVIWHLLPAILLAVQLLRRAAVRGRD